MGLTACGDSITAIDSEPVLKAAPKPLTLACAKPLTLPNRALKQSEVETMWREDREALLNCGLTKQALLDFYVERDSRLSGS